MVAELFAPGIISTKNYEHSSPAFSPDGSVVLWTIMDSTYHGYLLEMNYENGKWSKPARPSFADTTADDYYPSFSPNGKKLFFSSRRKAPQGYPERSDMRIWEVERNQKGWGSPQPFDTTISQGHEYAHSVTKKGTFYFSSREEGGTNFNIRKSEMIKGGNAQSVLLPYSINSVDYEDGPYVAPDESFLIFESQRPEGIDGYLGLYISFRDENGHWRMPVNMGPKINSGKGERFARLSPDGKYLFFGSFRNMSAGNRGADIFWIDAKVIDELRNNETANMKIEQPLGDELINALHKNDTTGSSGLLKQWLSLYPESLDATVIYSSILRKQERYSEAEQLLAKNVARWNKNANIIMEKALIKFAAEKDDEAYRLLAPILTEGSQLRGRYLYLSNSLFDLAKFKPSDEYFEKAMAISAHGVFWYNRGCGYTHLGHKDKAFEALNKAADLGHNERKNYEADPDLVPLRSDTKWKLLLKKLK
ncbi:MAG: TPR end-of-group domain-containing protein [Chitinophagaceae bacterium]